MTECTFTNFTGTQRLGETSEKEWSLSSAATPVVTFIVLDNDTGKTISSTVVKAGEGPVQQTTCPILNQTTKPDGTLSNNVSITAQVYTPSSDTYQYVSINATRAGMVSYPSSFPQDKLFDLQVNADRSVVLTGYKQFYRGTWPAPTGIWKRVVFENDLDYAVAVKVQTRRMPVSTNVDVYGTDEFVVNSGAVYTYVGYQGDVFVCTVNDGSADAKPVSAKFDSSSFEQNFVSSEGILGTLQLYKGADTCNINFSPSLMPVPDPPAAGPSLPPAAGPSLPPAAGPSLPPAAGPSLPPAGEPSYVPVIPRAPYKSQGLTGGQIAGIVIASLVVLAASVAVYVFARKLMKDKTMRAPTTLPQ